MRLPEFDHFEPETLSEACGLLRKYPGRAKLVAGGTDLLNLLRQGLAAPEFLIDLKRVSELKTLRYDEARGLLIGPLLTLAELIRSPLVQEKAPLLAEAAKSVGAPPLQNMGTIGGNLCLNTRCFFYNQSAFWRSSHPPCFKTGGALCLAVKNSKQCQAVFQADAACALVALNARVKVVEDGGERDLALSEFFTGRGEEPHCLKPTEVVSEILIPPGRLRGSYEKLSARAALDFPQVGVAVAAGHDPEGRIREARIVLNAVAPQPIRVEAAEALLAGSRLDAARMEMAARSGFEAVHPVHNTGGSPLYRRKMAGALIHRALQKLSL